MLQAKPITTGKLVGTIYDFAEKGDELAVHDHLAQPETTHISIVARGSFLAFGDGWQEELSTGQIADFMPEIKHGFKALEANSRLINIQKGQHEADHAKH